MGILSSLEYPKKLNSKYSNFSIRSLDNPLNLKMKLFKYITLAGFALATTELNHRAKRDTSISITGEENPDQLMDYLNDLSDGDVDELEQAIMQFMGVDRITSDDQLRKFRQLKIAVLWLQEEKKFGRYCYYGCYCLPEGSHNIASGGYGKPQDPIDKACFEFKNCYRCLLDEHSDESKECRGEEFGYRMDLNIDSQGNKEIVCTNKPGSCRYNICQCDKALAEKLAQHEKSWNEDLHTVKGGFVRDDVCFKPQGGIHKFEECCGNKSTFPFNQPRRSNQCCDGNEAKPAGQC